MRDNESRQEVKRTYNSLRHFKSGLIKELKKLIEDYLKNRDRVNSHVAGGEILGEWNSSEEFSNACDVWSSQVFGMVFYDVCMANGWQLVAADEKFGSKGKTHVKTPRKP